MQWLWQAFVDHPEIAIFLALGVGFWVGKFEVKGIGLGSVTGTLLVGVIIGAIVSVPGPNGAAQTIDVDDVTKQVFFLLFLFALGYRVGPQFFHGLRSNGPQVIFTLALITFGIITTIVLASILGYNPGLAAGLSAGALTQSSIIGVAQDAISGLSEDQTTLQQWSDLVSVGYAVTYIFGTIGAAIYCASIAPRLLGISDLAAAAAEEEQRLGFADPKPDTASAFQRIARRAYAVPQTAAGQMVADLESSLESTTGVRVHVDRAWSGGVVFDDRSDHTLAAGDEVALASVGVDAFQAVEAAGYTEVEDSRLLDFPVEEIDVVVTSDDVAGNTFAELGRRSEARGIFVTRLARVGHELPLLPNTEVAKGDIIRLQGPRPLVESIVDEVGYPERSTPQTDIVTVGLGITVGALIGLPTLVVGNVPLSLTSSVGAMLIGLIIGWRRSMSPTFGRIPSGAQWFFESVGLAAFVGIVGIDSGPGFVDGLSEYGLGLLGAGVVVTLVPLVASTYLARYVFKFDPVQTLGMLTGAQTTTAAIGAVRESARSSVPLLGFTVPYAVGNILLSIAGAIVVAVMA